MPPTLPYLWGDYKTLNREVLVLQREEKFESAPNKSSGLDLSHVLLAVEWLAKLHGLSYVAKRTFENENPQEDWLKKHPWIRREMADNSKIGLTEPPTHGKIFGSQFGFRGPVTMEKIPQSKAIETGIILLINQVAAVIL